MKRGKRKKKRRVYVHYGDSRFRPEKFGEIKNGYMAWVKPYGGSGLWASPVKTRWGWRDFCTSEHFLVEELENCFKFTLKCGAKVAHIRQFMNLFCLPRASESDPRLYCIDFEEAAKHYDAIEVHLTEDKSMARLYNYLYGWDCDSILVLNPDVVEEVKK